MTIKTPNPNPTCPECGAELNAWMTAHHTPECPIGKCEDATRAHDMDQLHTLEIPHIDRPPRPHEIRLQQALGYPPESIPHIRVIPSGTSGAHLYPPKAFVDDMPGQWIRVVPPGHEARYNTYRKES